MDPQRKFAYRYLLYWAMLEIRSVQWLAWRGWQSWNPWYWRGQGRWVRYTGAVANWLHNLALHAALDFVRFDEDRFWSDFEAFRSRHPGFGWDHYREMFEQQLSGTDGPNA